MRFLLIYCCLLMCLWPCAVRTERENQCKGGTYEEGKDYNWRCWTSNLEDTMGWQLKQNDQYVNISTCNSQGRCTDYMSPYTSKLIVGEDGGDKYTMKVYLKAKKEESTIRCFYDSTFTRDVCNEIFVRPSPPVCDPPTLENSDTQISIRCTTDRVYPSALLVITMQKDGFPDGPTADINCKTFPSKTHPGYKSTECTAFFPLSGLKPNPYQFHVAMYPDISNVTMAKEKKVESHQPYSVVLTAPSVRLSDQCPVSTYMTSGRCKCELMTQDYSPGQARWYTQTGQVVGTENSQDRSSSLSFSYHSSGANPRYECKADTVLDVLSSATVSFSPKIATGPGSVTIEATYNKFDLCPSEEHTVTLTCKVPRVDVTPGVKLTITVDGVAVVDSQEGLVIGDHYVQDYTFRPSRGGNYFVTCTAQNLVSSQLSMTKNLELAVREPPTTAPLLLVSRNQPGSEVASVVAGDEIDITCKVDGGYPKVNEVTVICGSKTEKGQGNLVVLTLKANKAMDKQICYCSALHDSGCYHRESQVKLQVNESIVDVDHEDVDNKLVLIIGPSAAAAVVIVVLLVVIVKLCKRTKRGSSAPNTEAYSHQNPLDQELNVYLDPRPPEYNVYDKIITNDDNPTCSGFRR